MYLRIDGHGQERPHKPSRITQQSIGMRAGVSGGGKGLEQHNNQPELRGREAKNNTIIVNHRGRYRWNEDTTTNRIDGER